MSTESISISVCIPTYNRPELLEHAIRSCLAQTYLPFEVIVSDDSNDAHASKVAEVLARLKSEAGAFPPILYERNRPSLGQANNVNRLFQRANGSHLMLMHDDDYLEPTALEVLSGCFKQYPGITIAFGKQRVVHNDGSPNEAATLRLNRSYYRTPERAGRLPIPALAGIDQMFPNNGYLVSTLEARAIGYDSTDRVLDACDFDFGLRICCLAAGICFVDSYTAVSRQTELSVSTHALPAMHAYAALAAIAVPSEARQARESALRRLAPRAASAYARAGDARSAWSILLSRRYPLVNKLSIRFLYHVMLAVRATLSKGISQ